MRKSSLTKLQKICIACFCLALTIFIASGITLILSEEEIPSDNYADEVLEGLADKMIYYPDNIYLNQPMSDIILYDSAGKGIYLSEFKGKNIILLFWSSWCKYCNNEFELIQEYESLFAQYEDTEIVLINKLDGERETKEKAEEYLGNSKTAFKSYYDLDLEIYNSLGLKVIPTFLGIDKEGTLKFCYPDNIKSLDQMRALIDYIRCGGAMATEVFITEKLTNDSGGVYVNYEASDSKGPSGHDILSESQGIMMEYAVKINNRDMFDQYLNFTMDNMLNKDVLAGWMISETNSQGYDISTVNSVIDDLRIYEAICSAEEQWGGYQGIKVQWNNAILRYNTDKNYVVDFYDFKSKKKAKRLTLCFADFEAIKNLEDTQENALSLYNNTFKIVTEGYIGNEFPLYYSWYDYNKKQYQSDDLNMAETLVTLLHLAEVGELKEETLAWLRTTVNNGGIKARYSVEGKIVKGFNYESTAIYALLVMIAEEVDDKVLLTQALARMEQMRINDQGSEFDGSFGGGEGKDIYSFDQCMALLAYAYVE